MELITNLGKQLVGKDMRLVGVFKCPYCLTHLTMRQDKGHTQKSCKNCRGKAQTKHGMAGTKVYAVWNAMRARCTNPNNKKYPIYGGKGISVFPKWETFEGFWEDNKDQYKEGLTIDRKDSSKDYCPENVRWIPLSQNSSETTKVRKVSQYRVALKPTKHLVHEKDWLCAKHAADALGLTAAHITAVCKGNRKTHGGFAWKYT